MRLIVALSAVLLVPPSLAAQELTGRWSSMVTRGEETPLWTDVNLWRGADGRWTGTESFTDMTTNASLCRGRLEWRSTTNGSETFAASGCGGGTVTVGVVGGQLLVYRREVTSGPIGFRRGTLTHRGAPERSEPAAARPAAVPGKASVLTVGGSVGGRLGAGSPTLSDGSFYGDHALVVPTAQRIRITMRSNEFDTVLGASVGAAAMVVDDDGAGGTDSRVEVDVPAGATVRIRANALSQGMQGAYTIQVERI